ncbi:hypothetical protein [Bacillus cereus]|uniref:hypothetical protein n=1 Tax=Bacillus cereus TaxID=1396 RepID=UPI00159706FD|nr:hypothetical protein [Bacillus cereus]
MKNKRKETLFLIFAFVFMTITRFFGNLYVAAFGLSVGLAFLTEIILKARGKDTRE